VPWPLFLCSHLSDYMLRCHNHKVSVIILYFWYLYIHVFNSNVGYCVVFSSKSFLVILHGTFFKISIIIVSSLLYTYCSSAMCVFFLFFFFFLLWNEGLMFLFLFTSVIKTAYIHSPCLRASVWYASYFEKPGCIFSSIALSHQLLEPVMYFISRSVVDDRSCKKILPSILTHI